MPTSATLNARRSIKFLPLTKMDKVAEFQPDMVKIRFAVKFVAILHHGAGTGSGHAALFRRNQRGLKRD
jgi:hypothetical protein